MGVKLRVESAGGVLAEGGGDDAFGVDDGDLAVDAVAGVGVVLDPTDHRRHRGVMSRQDLGSDERVAECEKRRHRLRRGRGDVEPSHRLLAVGAPERRSTGAWVDACHDVKEVGVLDLAAQAEQVGASPLPPPRRFVGVQVVRRQRLDVVEAGVGALQRRDPSGHDDLSRTAVHSSVALVLVGGEMAAGDMGVRR